MSVTPPQLTPAQFQAVENPRLDVPGLRTDIEEAPYPFQLVDSAYLCYYKRALLAEYPAAGKKIIAIMTILKLFALGEARDALILSLGTDCSQWIEEIDHWTEGVTTQLYRGSVAQRRRMLENEVDIRVATYSTARSDIAGLLNRHTILVADEVSILKNTDTDLHPYIRCLFAPTLDEQRDIWSSIETTSQQKNIAKGRRYERRPFPNNGKPSPYAFGLSATPYETGPMDVFSLYWCLLGEKNPLGTDPAKFKDMNCHVSKTKMRIKTGKVDHRGKPKTKKITIEKVHGLTSNAKPRVKKQIGPYYMRHPWSTVAPFLPELQVVPRWLELTGQQKTKYREISNGDLIWKWKKQQQRKEVGAALKQFYQLRCCDGLTSLPGQSSRHSAKLTDTMNLLTGEFGGEKVLFFSRFYQPIDDLSLSFH